MRVLLVHEGDDWIRGSERCMLDLAWAMQEMGWNPVIACNAPAVLREAQSAGVRTIRTAPSTRSGPLPGWRETHEWRRILLQAAPQVVHVNSVIALPPILVCGMLRRIPVLVHQHILDDDFSRLYSLMHQASAIVTISETARAALEQDGYPSENLVRISNGVRTQPATGDVTLREVIRAGHGDAIAVSVGSLIHRKGHDRVLAAFQVALRTEPSTHLAIIGSGEDETSLRAIAERLGVVPRVHFLGQRSDVQALLRTADFFVTGAREEVQPLSVIEAMLCALPVVASDIPAHLEMVRHGSTGLLVKADDVEHFGAAIARASSDRAWRGAARAKLQVDAPTQYSFESYVGRFTELYTHLASAPSTTYGFPRTLRWIDAYARWVWQYGRRKIGGARR